LNEYLLQEGAEHALKAPDIEWPVSGTGVDSKERRFTMVRDPVCGMEVDEASAGATAVYHGKTYSFCSEACKTTFEKDPGKYAAS